MTLIKCLNCQKQHDVRQAEINRGNGKFCSQSCASLYDQQNKRKANCVCNGCGSVFYRIPSKIGQCSKSGLIFCTRQCKDKSQRIGGISEIQPDHYTNKVSIKNYRVVARRELPLSCNRCGYDHNTDILQVHHKDRNRNNNTINNLEILCPNCHAIEHWSKSEPVENRTL